MDESPRKVEGLEELCRQVGYLPGDPLADDLGGPAGKVHDWRNYVDELRPLWPSLSRETRMAVAIIAESRASAEDWD